MTIQQTITHGVTGIASATFAFFSFDLTLFDEWVRRASGLAGLAIALITLYRLLRRRRA